MKLFGTPGSPFVRKVRIVLAGLSGSLILRRGRAPAEPGRGAVAEALAVR